MYVDGTVSAIKTRRSTSSLNKSFYNYAFITTFPLIMCYMYVDVCRYCNKQEVVNMELCLNRMRIGICLSHDYDPSVMNENDDAFLKIPVSKNRITGFYEMKIADLIHTEYAEMMCYTCEKKNMNAGTDTFDD